MVTRAGNFGKVAGQSVVWWSLALLRSNPNDGVRLRLSRNGNKIKRKVEPEQCLNGSEIERVERLRDASLNMSGSQFPKVHFPWWKKAVWLNRWPFNPIGDRSPYSELAMRPPKAKF